MVRFNDDSPSRQHERSTKRFDIGGRDAPAGAGRCRGLHRTAAIAARRDRGAPRVTAIDDSRVARLLEANQQLVLAALQAQALAETVRVELDELLRANQHDALTGTPNRLLTLDRLHNAIAMAQRHRGRVAVLFLDIDNFKRINDEHGHAVGDRVLQQVARRLEGAVRASDTVSRHGGDEFLVLLPEVSGASDAAQVATKMLACLAAAPDPADAADGSDAFGALALPVTASIGIALFPDDGADAVSLIARADAAMYRAKADGGATFHCCDGASADDDAARRPAPPLRAVTGPHAPDTHDAADTPEPRLVRDLRDANQQLLLSALTARELEAEATQATLRQSQFLAMVAHELRNPLVPIRMATDMLIRRRGDEAQQARLLETISQQVAHLVRIIEDLLDGSRANTGKFHLAFATVDLAGVFRQAADACHPAITLRRQQLALRLPDAPLAVRGDAVRLTQIFRNLLDNASKYTPADGAIALAAVASGEAVVITVSDTGIGITPQALPHVFDLFVQDPLAAAMHDGGLGIGLAVVRELVLAHGGTVVASSAGPGLGSEFAVTLPRVMAAVAPSADLAHAAPGALGQAAGR